MKKHLAYLILGFVVFLVIEVPSWSGGQANEYGRFLGQAIGSTVEFLDAAFDGAEAPPSQIAP